MACVLGGIVGYERERNDSKAGFRTHTLVCLGSALIMIISIYGFEGLDVVSVNKDPARLAAQVVSGIGFLGAGTILRDRTSIKGLTTAASLWVVAAIGLAVGAGYYVSALFVTLLVFIVLERFIEIIFFRSCQNMTIVIAPDGPKVREINNLIEDSGIIRNNISVNMIKSYDGKTVLEYKLRTPFRKLNWEKFVEDINLLEGVDSLQKGEDSKSPLWFPYRSPQSWRIRDKDKDKDKENPS